MLVGNLTALDLERGMGQFLFGQSERPDFGFEPQTVNAFRDQFGPGEQSQAQAQWISGVPISGRDVRCQSPWLADPVHAPKPPASETLPRQFFPRRCRASSRSKKQPRPCAPLRCAPFLSVRVQKLAAPACMGTSARGLAPRDTQIWRLKPWHKHLDM